MASPFHVQKGVAIPEVDRSPKKLARKYPLADMAVGDMIFAPERSVRSLSSYISRISKRVPGKFATRQCCMRRTSDGSEWVVCAETDPGAVKGAGVWRIV